MHNLHTVVGDDALESALSDEESLCMDKVYDALDWYKKAVIETRETEVYWIYSSTVCSQNLVSFSKRLVEVKCIFFAMIY